MISLLAACAAAEPAVQYGGRMGGPAKDWDSVVVFRSTQPDRPYEDLGTVHVTCPTEMAKAFGGGVEVIGGCSYEYALYLAQRRVGAAGADGLFGVDTSTAGNGNVVALVANAFRFTEASPPSDSRATSPAAAQAPASPAPEPVQAPTPGQSIEERLRRLQKLRDENLITPEEHDRRKAEILKEL